MCKVVSTPLFCRKQNGGEYVYVKQQWKKNQFCFDIMYIDILELFLKYKILLCAARKPFVGWMFLFANYPT
jgi:hypothetical protein